MAVSYKKLWKLLIDKDMMKKEGIEKASDVFYAAVSGDELHIQLRGEQ